MESFDLAQINKNRIKDLGNRIIVTGTIAIANQWMHYKNADGSDRYEYLPEETLFNLDSLSTLQGAPLAVEHPEKIGYDNYRELVGQGKIVGSVSTQINVDRNNKHLDIIATIYDKPTIDEVLKGGITELSPRYWKDCKPHPDYDGSCFIQTLRDYRDGEVSLVKTARGGKNAKVHLADSYRVTEAPGLTSQGTRHSADGLPLGIIESPPLKKKFFITKDTMDTTPIEINGIKLEISKDSQEKAQEIKVQVEQLKTDLASAIASKDALEAVAAKLEAENSILNNKIISQAEAREKQALIDKVTPMVAQDNLSELTTRQIKEKVISSVLPSLDAVKNSLLGECTDSQIEAYFEVAATLGAVSHSNHTSDKQESLLNSAIALDSGLDAAIEAQSKDYYQAETNGWKELLAKFENK